MNEEVVRTGSNAAPLRSSLPVLVADERRSALLAELRRLQGPSDIEIAHHAADDALLAYIGDAEITAAYEAIERWYA